MLNKIEILYSAEGTENILSDLGVKLHGAVMSLIPREYAARLHKTAYQPFSLYAVKTGSVIKARVCALNEEAAQICGALSDARELPIYGTETPPVQIESTRFPPVTVEEIEERLPEKLRFSIITPAMIKMNRVPSCPPDITRYFRSAAEKYALFESAFDYERFRELFSRLRTDKWALRGGTYNKSGELLPGLTGYLELELPRNKQMLRRLIAYAEYSGIGAKTALGMGAVEITPQSGD